MAKCSSCGAEIIWIKTKSGKSMPCDPEERFYEERIGGHETYVTPDGRTVKGVPCYGGPAYGYISHFATCPNADRHRRNRK